MSWHRSRGRNNPSRGDRVERRAAERREREPARMDIPAAVRALPRAKPPARQHLPCLVDPDCTVDHLHRRRRRAAREEADRG